MTSSPSSRLARAGLFAGLMTLTASTACVGEQEFVVVERAIFFDGDSCLLTDSSPSQAMMTIDVGYFGGSIAMGFVVTNNQVPDSGSASGVDDSEVVLDTAEVTLSFSGGGLAVSSFEVPIPSTSIGSGDTVIHLVEVPSGVADSVRTTMAGLGEGSYEYLDMEVIFKGRRMGQVGKGKLGAVETRPFTFPFEICYGCLALCLPATDCGGVAGDPNVCPAPPNPDILINGLCGHAQGGYVYAQGCSPSGG